MTQKAQPEFTDESGININFQEANYCQTTLPWVGLQGINYLDLINDMTRKTKIKKLPIGHFL